MAAESVYHLLPVVPHYRERAAQPLCGARRTPNDLSVKFRRIFTDAKRRNMSTDLVYCRTCAAIADRA